MEEELPALLFLMVQASDLHPGINWNAEIDCMFFFFFFFAFFLLYIYIYI
jgi:hypothetical protein